MAPGARKQNGCTAFSGLPCVLLQVRTGAEQYVATQLKARNVRAYYPRFLVNVRQGGLVAKALFPGYLFAWAKASAWPVIRTLPGVRDFVRRGGQVELVSPKVVYAIRAREGPTGYVRIDSTFVAGSQVIVKDRAEWAGVYLGMSQTHKARVLFTMLGAGVELELFESQLAAS